MRNIFIFCAFMNIQGYIDEFFKKGWQVMTRIGGYEVSDLGNGRYACSVTNGNMGAFVTDEAGLLKLREKYSKNEDTVEISSKEEKKPTMSYEEARVGLASLGNPIVACLASLNPTRMNEILDAMKYYKAHPDEVKNNAQAAS